MANLQLIKQLAEERKIPITQLAAMVQVSEQQIHLMCRTNSTKIETLEKIAKALGVRVGYFFDEEVMEVRQSGGDYVEHGNIEHNGTEYRAETMNVGAPSEDAAVMAEKVKALEALLAEKERLIQVLMRK